MTAKFGTSGLRGLNEELIGEAAISYTRGFVQYLLGRRLLRRGVAILVSRDFRSSSPIILENIAEALRLEGMGMVDFGLTPTPALAFEAMARGTAAIMITGSHIPDDRNGLKFYKPTGEIDKRDELGIVACQKNLAINNSSNVALAHKTARSSFSKRFLSVFSSVALQDMRIGVYQHSTVARDMLVDILQGLGAIVTPLARSEKFVAVDTEAVSDDVQSQLKSWCQTGEFDAVVSADGDGDRPLVADEKGQIVRGDLLGLIAARFLGAKVIVTPITSNSGLDRAFGSEVLRTKVGSPHVISAMDNARSQGKRGIVGFEANGGFFTASHFGKLKPLPTRDCVLPILTALLSAKREHLELSTFAAQFNLPVCLSDTLKVPSFEVAKDVMGRLLGPSQSFEEFGAISSRNLQDGLRLNFENGSALHLRPSGNAPEFRIYVEGTGLTQAEAVLAKAHALITQMFSLK